MALRRKVVDLVGLGLLDDVHQAAGIGHVTEVQEQSCAGLMRILGTGDRCARCCTAMSGASRRGRCALAQQEFRQVSAILACNTGNQGFFHGL